MKQHFIVKNQQKHLLLFFAGWGMDEHPFEQYVCPEGCDWMVCYDYRSLEFDKTLVDRYSEITVIAWSMGIWAASQIMRRYSELPVARSIAVNGTPYPIDEWRGIAPAIFEGTLQGMNVQTLQKFQRRMCGSATEYKSFLLTPPRRSVEELTEELAAIKKMYLSSDMLDSRCLWQKVVIGKTDRIFLPENQRRAWEEIGKEYVSKEEIVREGIAEEGIAKQIEEVEAAHYQKELFQSLLTEASTLS